MLTRPTHLSAYLAAGFLAVITLSVFARLQDYGPESAIRRFHADVMNENARDLRQVTAEPLDSPNVRRMASNVYNALRQGATFEIVLTDRSPSQVRAAVRYVFPKGDERYLIWVVEPFQNGWRVNADKTWTIIDDLKDSRRGTR